MCAETAKCCECGEVKPLEDFNKNVTRPNGRQGYCRECARGIKRRDYLKKKKLNRVPSGVTEKECTICKTLKPLDEYGNHPLGKYGKKPECKPCEVVRKRQWQIDNPDAAAANRATRRAREKDAYVKLTEEEDAQVRELYAERDRLTQETGIQHHVDHIKPLAKGGIHHPDNLQVLTATENLKKSDKWPLEETPLEDV